MQEKTLYEILEVSENASPEIIEKAYKVLAKKYHPDLQQAEEKKNAETKMKQINEAYEILGNTQKRKEYDEKLKNEREQKTVQSQNAIYYDNASSQTPYAAYNAYDDYLRSLGFKVKHRWTKENVKDFFIVILIMAVIITILWFIPPTHDWMVNFYEQNPILKTIIDIIIAIITGIFTGIWNFVSGLFS